MDNTHTWRKAEGSLSFRTSMENWRSPVVLCSFWVQWPSCSLNTRFLCSCSCLMLARSCAFRNLMASMSASHWATTEASNSRQLSCANAIGKLPRLGKTSLDYRPSIEHLIIKFTILCYCASQLSTETSVQVCYLKGTLLIKTNLIKVHCQHKYRTVIQPVWFHLGKLAISNSMLQSFNKENEWIYHGKTSLNSQKLTWTLVSIKRTLTLVGAEV